MSAAFVALRIAVVTVSDSRTLETDRSGAVLVEKLQAAGHQLAQRFIIPDDLIGLSALLRELADDVSVDVVITTGGTGLTGRDITPEALDAVATKHIPGFGELFRMLSYEKIRTSTIQSRACAVLCGNTFIFALPGSPGACKDGWDDILQYQLDIRHRPCNFAELIPRLLE
ncbi:MAG: molybdenum cofactor biosynthesis protein B [Polyangiales bacterium]|jgi:molybdenum cofactor biosynthesis protein B